MKLKISQRSIKNLVKPNFRIDFNRVGKFKVSDSSLRRWLGRSRPEGLLVELTGTTQAIKMLAVTASVSDSSRNAKTLALTQLILVGSVLPPNQGLVDQLRGWIQLHTSHPSHYGEGQTWGIELGGVLLTQRLDAETGLFTLTARSTPVHKDLVAKAEVTMDN